MLLGHGHDLTSLHSGRHLGCQLLVWLHSRSETEPPLVLNQPVTSPRQTLLPTCFYKTLSQIACNTKTNRDYTALRFSCVENSEQNSLITESAIDNNYHFTLHTCINIAIIMSKMNVLGQK